MIRRSQLPNLLVLCAAIAVGAAVFVLVGRMAGALYGGAALVLGLLVHQKLARGQETEGEPETPDDEIPERVADPLPEPGHTPRRRPSLHLAGKRRRELEAELVHARSQLVEREAALAELAGRLEEQQERTRELQAAFAERVDELTETSGAARAELAAAREAHEERVAALQAAVSEARSKLGEYEGLLGDLRGELARSRAAEQALADRLSTVEAAQREGQARLAWSWRAHVEEIAALESAVDRVLHSPH